LVAGVGFASAAEARQAGQVFVQALDRVENSLASACELRAAASTAKLFQGALSEAAVRSRSLGAQQSWERVHFFLQWVDTTVRNGHLEERSREMG